MADPAPAEATCRVWWAPPSSVGLCHLRLLDGDEARRWRRFRRDGDRARMLTGVALAKTVLAAALGVRADEVRFDRRCDRCGRPHGKPRLADPGAGVHFSVSHSGDRVVVAVTTVGPVGVDVEGGGAGPQLLRRARAVLTGAEFTRWSALPSTDREAALLRTWTRKESLVKATGHGLALPLDRIGVDELRGRPVLREWPASVPRPTVALQDLRPGTGYHACLAVLGPGPCRVQEDDGSLLLHRRRLPSQRTTAA